MLYNFDNLRKLVNKIAPSPVEVRKLNLIVEGEHFTSQVNKGNVIYRGNGIFIKINGEEFQRYIYKKYYSVSYGGGEQFPAFHFIQCSTVIEYGISNYYSASKDSVLIIDKYTGKKHYDKVLRVCKNCAYEASVYVPEDTAAFFKNIDKRTEQEMENKEVDIFGYTFDWHEIRINYLDKQENRCERCKIQMEGFDKKYLHVHHKNGDKKWNYSSNLECLCILCHSLVDERHIENFRKNRMKQRVNEFIEKYHSEIKNLNYKCLIMHNKIQQKSH